MGADPGYTGLITRNPINPGPECITHWGRMFPYTLLSGVPAGISHDGFPGFWDYRVLRAAPRTTVQGVPAEAILRAGFRCPLPSWNPSGALLCESPGWPPGGQTSPEPVSTAIGTKDNLRQYVAPLRLAPEGETTIIMVAVCWEDNPEDLLQRLEEIHRGDQPPRMGEIPGETPGDHINRKKKKRSGARVKALRTYRENETPRIAAGIFLWDTLQLVLSSPKL